MEQEIKFLELSEIESNDLLAFDEVLSNYDALNKNPGDARRLNKFIIRCLISIGGKPDVALECNDDNVEENAKNGLDHFYELKNKPTLAICYLRLISSNAFKWVSEHPWRPKVLNFLDNVFEQDLYKEWKINIKDQSHEKIKHLEETIPEREKLLDRVLSSMTSLERVPKSRGELMKVLNDKTGKVLFHPFFPNNFVALLSDVFDRYQEYLDQRDTIKIISCYNEALKANDQLIDQLNNFGTTYCKELALKFGETIEKYLREDIKTNKAAQPANVSIRASKKNYPLHNVGKKINIDFFINNEGPGYAYDAKIEIIEIESKIKFDIPIVYIGQVLPNETRPIQIQAEVLEVCSEVEGLLNLIWRNFDSEINNKVLDIKLTAQRTDINWEDLETTDPYSLHPIIDKKNLVGRKDVLTRLIASTNSPNIGSNIIKGQKRVGKTSIAKVLQDMLDKNEFLVVYIETGDFNTPSPDTTIMSLGQRLCEKLFELDRRIDFIDIPSFDIGFSPICKFVDEINKYLPEKKIVFIIDEFDELNIDLYFKNIWGTPFFSTLRSLSSREFVGFVLVGGEKMDLILENQGIQLNKWGVIPVDYFIKEKDWLDYTDLIKRPVEEFLEFSDEAIQELHTLTAGNPYFTKLICQHIFRAAIKSRDCSICQMEVVNAVDHALLEINSNTFQHFWDDRIFFTDVKATEISLRRRRILIALADILRTSEFASGLSLRNHQLLRNSYHLESDIKEFVTRQVLNGEIIGSFDDNRYNFKINLFHLWMKNRGIHEIISTFSDLDAALKEKQNSEELKVKSEQLVALASDWGLYKGRHITTENIRAWLDQFNELTEQKSMFSILKGVRFFTNSFLREKMNEAHKIAMRSITKRIAYGQKKRDDILVSYLDSIENSGAGIARLYADETKISVGNLVEKGKLGSKLEESDQIQAIVFLDDFVGTGNQAVENLTEIYQSIGSIVKKKEIKIIFIVMVAVIDGWNYLNESIKGFDIEIETHYCDLLCDNDKYFSNSSKIFLDEDSRVLAKSIAEKYGKQIVTNNPLGYGNLGVGVVFEHGCPNDSLPILWAEKTSPHWFPLFKRL
ncbi:MAG: ATP-binding protein [Anaerolineaceae bacterium]